MQSSQCCRPPPRLHTPQGWSELKAQASSSQGGGCRVGARTRRGIHTLGDGVSLTRFSVAPPSCPTTLCVWRNLAYLTYLTRGRRAHTYDIGQHPNSGANRDRRGFSGTALSGVQRLRASEKEGRFTRTREVIQSVRQKETQAPLARPLVRLYSCLSMVRRTVLNYLCLTLSSLLMLLCSRGSLLRLKDQPVRLLLGLDRCPLQLEVLLLLEEG